LAVFTIFFYGYRIILCSGCRCKVQDSLFANTGKTAIYGGLTRICMIEIYTAVFMYLI